MEHKTGLEDFYVIKNNKKLRMGYTTGACAAGAAKGAAEMVLSGSIIREISLMTPKGILLHLELHDITMEANSVTCAVRKQAGDDPDTTVATVRVGFGIAFGCARGSMQRAKRV